MLSGILTTGSCTPTVLLQVPEALAQSFRVMWEAIAAHIGSGKSMLLAAGALRRLGGILSKAAA